MKQVSAHKLKGFTVAELLVVMALTSITITLAYGTLTYVQKLFADYKKQNQFLNAFADLKERMDQASRTSDFIVETNNNTFEIKRDSSTLILELLEEKILLRQGDRCDTFQIAAKSVFKSYEVMNNPAWQNKLVTSLRFETIFGKQKFTGGFFKAHDAALKLALDKENTSAWPY